MLRFRILEINIEPHKYKNRGLLAYQSLLSHVQQSRPHLLQSHFLINLLCIMFLLLLFIGLKVIIVVSLSCLSLVVVRTHASCILS